MLSRFTRRAESPTALAIHLAFAGIALAPIWLPGAVHAQQPAATARNYNIPGGPLAAALTRFVGESGILLAGSAELTQGKASPGLQGRHSEQAGLALLLAGSGLEAVRSASGEYTLRRAAAAPASAPAPSAQARPTAAAPVVAANTAVDTSLPTIVVKGQADRSGTSEGTGSYSARVASSATKMALSLRETPQSVTVITSQMIEDKGLTSMEQVLNHTPGVTMVGDASENSQIFVRGFYLDTGVQVDGLSTTSAQPIYEGSISQGLDPSIADRVEVIKGAAGIVAGLGEPSATVNFIRKRPTDTFQAHAQLSAGRWDRYSAEADVSGPLSQDGRIRGRLVGAYRHADSFMDRYGSEKTVLYGVIDADLTPDTLVSLAVDHQRSKTDGAYNWNSNPAFYTDGGAFDAGRSFSTGQEWTYWDVEQYSLTPSVEHRFGNGWSAKLSFRYAKADIDRVSFYPGDYVDRATGQLIGAWQSTYADRSLRSSDTRSVDLYATGPFTLLGRKHELVLGLSQGRNKFGMGTYNIDPDTSPMADYFVGTGAVGKPTFASTATYDNLYDQQQAGVYTTARLNLADPLKLMIGGRFSNWKHISTNRVSGEVSTVKQDDIFTPYVGLVYDVNEVASVYASYTGIFKPVTNRGADGALLDPTEGRNMELGVKLALFNDRLNASFAVYETLQDNYAEYANLGQLPNGEWIYRSIDGVKTRGFEAEVSGRVAAGWELSAGYTHNKAKDAAGNPKLTYIPEDLFKISVSHALNADLTVGGGVRWQSDSYYDTGIYSVSPSIPARQVQKAYSLVDLMARYRFSRSLSATLNINNLLDEKYNRSMWGYADYGEPRSVTVGLRADW